MIGNNPFSAVLVSTDLDRSRAFFEQKVGLKLSSRTIKNHLLFECGNGTTILVYGFKSAFLPFREKQDLLRQVNAEIGETLAKYQTRPSPST